MKTPTTPDAYAEALDDIDRARADLADFCDEELTLSDGTVARVADILDDLKADVETERVVDALAEVALAGRLH